MKKLLDDRNFFEMITCIVTDVEYSLEFRELKYFDNSIFRATLLKNERSRV